jgi:hypothetical protein
VEDWVPAGWLDGADERSSEEARELILDEGMAISKGVNRKDLAKKLGLRK